VRVNVCVEGAIFLGARFVHFCFYGPVYSGRVDLGDCEYSFADVRDGVASLGHRSEVVFRVRNESSECVVQIFEEAA